jgi:hypothetical protein
MSASFCVPGSPPQPRRRGKAARHLAWSVACANAVFGVFVHNDYIVAHRREHSQGGTIVPVTSLRWDCVCEDVKRALSYAALARDLARGYSRWYM